MPLISSIYPSPAMKRNCSSYIELLGERLGITELTLGNKRQLIGNSFRRHPSRPWWHSRHGVIKLGSASAPSALRRLLW